MTQVLRLKTLVHFWDSCSAFPQKTLPVFFNSPLWCLLLALTLADLKMEKGTQDPRVLRQRCNDLGETLGMSCSTHISSRLDLPAATTCCISPGTKAKCCSGMPSAKVMIPSSTPFWDFYFSLVILSFSDQ